MPIELLLRIGLLLGAVASAFAISSMVGLLIARLWVISSPLHGAPRRAESPAGSNPRAPAGILMPAPDAVD